MMIDTTNIKDISRRAKIVSPSQRRLRVAALPIVILFAVSQASAQEKVSVDELAKELSNPNTSLGTLNFPIDYVSYKGDLPGAKSQESWRVGFQPVLPYKLGEGVNLYVRPYIPILIDQPIPLVGGADVAPTPVGQFGINDANFRKADTELGDIGFDIAIGKTFPSKTILVGGVVGTLDTATDDAVGLGQTLLGPEAMIAQITDWGVLGVMLSHQWDVAGDDDFDTSITGGQYFYAINLSNGWQIQASPTFSYNHEVSGGGEKWTLPIGTGIAKTTILGKTPWKFSLQYWHYVKQSDAIGPDYQIRFTLGPVVPLPW